MGAKWQMCKANKKTSEVQVVESDKRCKVVDAAFGQVVLFFVSYNKLFLKAVHKGFLTSIITLSRSQNLTKLQLVSCQYQEARAGNHIL